MSTPITQEQRRLWAQDWREVDAETATTPAGTLVERFAARVHTRALAEVARLERERDKWMAEAMARDELAEKRGKMLSAAESRLADAERRGAREVLTRCANDADIGFSGCGKGIREWRDREYPAVPPEREGARTCHRGGECLNPTTCSTLGPCVYRPTPPQAAPEPLEVIARSPLGSAFTLTLTPAVCQRIVETARRASGRGE